MPGPLQDLKVVELGGIGPVPHAGMMLADLGADVITLTRPNVPDDQRTRTDILNRGKRSMAVDLKNDGAREIVLSLVERSSVLIEGFRPGVAERLGLGPTDCHRRNPDLVYGRMTGWGQSGPLASMAGHDIDYISVSGVLSAIGPVDQPFPPLNLVGDFGGGSMLLVVGVLAALWGGAAREVVDAAMVDGSALLTAMQHGGIAGGWWVDRRGEGLFDGSAPFYTTYPTSDGEWVAVGALEPHFYADLLSRLGLSQAELPAQMDRDGWPVIRSALEKVFATRSRSEWEEVFAGTDSCVVGVYSMTEAPRHNHNVERGTFIEVDGGFQPAPAPRFASVGERVRPGPIPLQGQHTREILDSLGLNENEITDLEDSGAVGT